LAPEAVWTLKFLFLTWIRGGHAVLQLVEALRYKPEVAGSISDGVIDIFN
jgi:hypothetical protein